MRYTYFLILFCSLLTQMCFGQKVSKTTTLNALELANTYFVNKWPDPHKSIITNKERPSNIWTRAVYYEGLMALNRIHPQQKYLDYANLWGSSHSWDVRGGYTTIDADNQACGQTYIDLFNLNKDSSKIKEIKKSIDYTISTKKYSYWTWIDAIQMAMPVFAKLGRLYNDDTTYYNYMDGMYSYARNEIGLYNEKDGLWWRDKDFLPPYKEPNGADCYWARGNGWVVAALVRVLQIIPRNSPYRKKYKSDLLDMLNALAPLQRNDGFWNVSLKDSSHFGGKETSGTALFVYGYAWAYSNHLSKSKSFRNIAEKGWRAILKDALHENGFLGFVQGTGKEPKDGQPVNYNSVPDFEDYGLGCFLLAGTEIYKL